MDNKFISFIYPSEEKRSFYLDPANRPRISVDECDQLGLTYLLNLKNGSLSDFFVSDKEVIEYRQEMFEDLDNEPKLVQILSDVVPLLCDISELRQMQRDNDNPGESYLYSITEIELYINCIDSLANGFRGLESSLHSPAFKNLYEFIMEFSESEYYKELNERLKKLSSHVHEIKSVTIGVNLDAKFRPTDTGVISINAESFKGGKILDKILRMSFKNDAMTCIAPLTRFGEKVQSNAEEAMSDAIHDAIEDVYRSSIRTWKTIVEAYVLENTDFLLKLLPEIEFVTKAHQMKERLKEKGYSLVMPDIRPIEDKEFATKGLYNPSVALQIDEEIVKNDFEFDDKARLYVLTGPNRGGKSVITCAVGIAQCLLQLGLGIPADTAIISPVDGIFTHFPTGAEDTIDKGRLGEECARLREIICDITENSMILFDESLSSTGSYEASYIASEILTGLAVARCRGIFSTHLHELAAHVLEINQKSKENGGIAIDTLVAGIEEGRRSFLILRAKPDGKSYAKDIAEKYGLSYEGIQKMIGKNEEK